MAAMKQTAESRSPTDHAANPLPLLEKEGPGEIFLPSLYSHCPVEQAYAQINPPTTQSNPPCSPFPKGGTDHHQPSAPSPPCPAKKMWRMISLEKRGKGDFRTA